MHKETWINKYDYLSKIHYCTHWHINSPQLLLCLCVLFYFLFVYTCVYVFFHNQSPLRGCRLIRSGASGLPYYCALVGVSEVIELLVVWRHKKPKLKIRRGSLPPGSWFGNHTRKKHSFPSQVTAVLIAIYYSWCWATRQSSDRSNRCAGLFSSIRDHLVQNFLSLAGPVVHWDIEK